MPPRKAQKTRGKQGASSREPACDHDHFINFEATEAYTKSLRRNLYLRGDLILIVLGWGIIFEYITGVCFLRPR